MKDNYISTFVIQIIIIVVLITHVEKSCTHQVNDIFVFVPNNSQQPGILIVNTALVK